MGLRYRRHDKKDVADNSYIILRGKTVTIPDSQSDSRHILACVFALPLDHRPKAIDTFTKMCIMSKRRDEKVRIRNKTYHLYKIEAIDITPRFCQSIKRDW